MIAVRSPLSALSPCSDSSKVAAFYNPTNSVSVAMSLDIDSSSKVQTAEPCSPIPNAAPRDISDPSPVASTWNGTEGTDFDETSEHEVETALTVASVPMLRARAPNSVQPELTIRTSNTRYIDFRSRSDDDEPPQSVIHAPPGFGDFKVGNDQSADETPKLKELSRTDSEVTTTKEPLAHDNKITQKKTANSPLSPPPLTTSIAPAKDWSERATPRAQTRQDFEEVDRRTHSSNLEDIPEGVDVEASARDGDGVTENFDFRIANFQNKEVEINALRAALAECWTLCNTLARLSYIHRERLTFHGKGDMQEEAWRSCWRLCQKLYDSQEDDCASQVSPTLDLCRDFCQALFEVRVRDNELADSVLRVSFELNNHLYNTHDRNLPDAFRERTLDFYITLCHRLMKQRTRLTETDSLLSACWSLAEMLFSIRQSKREGKLPDEELLGPAVQACWELCDIFREGWTLRNLRSSDRGTPRPSQTTFTQPFHQAKQSEFGFADETQGQQGNPETPTTIFEDTVTLGSPDEAPTPNILVLGHGLSQVSRPKWSSNSSSISGQSRSSEQTTSSSHTVKTVSEDPNLTRLKVLITKAAINSGYQRNGSQSFSSFVKSLSSDAFGSMPWQMSLLKNYKNSVAFDPALKNVGPQARESAVDVSRAVQAMVRNEQYSWLRDLYRLVFGFHVEEAVSRKGVTVQI